MREMGILLRSKGISFIEYGGYILKLLSTLLQIPFSRLYNSSVSLNTLSSNSLLFCLTWNDKDPKYIRVSDQL